MLMHLRLNLPRRLTEATVALLRDHQRTTNLVVLPGASVRPEGDVVTCDVPKESLGAVLDALDGLGLDEFGGITVTALDAAPFDEARRLDELAAGDPDDSVIWDMVTDQAEQGASLSWNFCSFLTLAAALAGVAVVTDSPILVVGAMVVSPDFLPVAAICVGLVFRRWGLAWRGARQLVLGYLLAVVVVALLALAARLTGALTAAQVAGPRPLTSFIWEPNGWSLVVALLAGAAGALALTSSKATTLVGVFISVTTIPAAGNISVALAVGNWGEVLGSLEQLGVNVLGMLVAGLAVLLAQRHVLRPPRDLLRR